MMIEIGDFGCSNPTTARVFLSKLSTINTQKDDYLRTAPHRLFQSVTIW